MTARQLVRRLDAFSDGWISNPSAALEFAKLIAAAHESYRDDRAATALLEWVDEQRETAKYLNIK